MNILTRSIKIKIRLTHDQENLCNQFFGALRYVYNKYLEVNKDFYDVEKSFCGAYLFSQLWNHSLKPDWFTLKISKAVKDEIMTAEKAFKRFFKTKKGFPKFKSKRNPVQSIFFVKVGIRLDPKDHSRVWIPILKWIKLCEKDYLKEEMIPYITSGRIIKNSGGYFVTFMLTDYPEIVKFDYSTTMDGIGIDLGITTYATIATKMSSQATIFNPINSDRYKILDYWIDKYNRAISNKINWNFKSHGYDISKGYPKIQKLKKGEATEIYNSHNILKLRKRIRKLSYQKQCIMEDFIKKLCNSLVRTKPEYITIEDLSLQLESHSYLNKHNKHMRDSRFYSFREFLTWKCSQYGIELRIADRAFPSSKICSCCGHVKKRSLALSTRVYHCKECGTKIDRDLNAAINLAKCKKFTLAV